MLRECSAGGRNIHNRQDENQDLRSFMVSFAIIFVGFSLNTDDAYALGVPKVSVDQNNISAENIYDVMVTGTVSHGKGQDIVIYATDEATVISQTRISSGGGRTSFQLRVPSLYLAGNKNSSENVSVYVQSLSAPGITASKKVPVKIKVKDPKKAQTIKAPSSVTAAGTAAGQRDRKNKEIKMDIRLA